MSVEEELPLGSFLSLPTLRIGHGDTATIQTGIRTYIRGSFSWGIISKYSIHYSSLMDGLGMTMAHSQKGSAMLGLYCLGRFAQKEVSRPTEEKIGRIQEAIVSEGI